MKKIILAIALIFSLTSKAQTISTYTPLAVHDFGTDSITGLDRQLWVKDFTVNAPMRRITIEYQIVYLSNNLPILSNEGSYIVDDSTPALNFTNYWSSSIGVAIRADFANDLNKIHSYPTLVTDLVQE